MPLVNVFVGSTKEEALKAVRKRGYSGNRYKITWAKLTVPTKLKTAK